MLNWIKHHCCFANEAFFRSHLLFMNNIFLQSWKSFQDFYNALQWINWQRYKYQLMDVSKWVSVDTVLCILSLYLQIWFIIIVKYYLAASNTSAGTPHTNHTAMIVHNSWSCLFHSSQWVLYHHFGNSVLWLQLFVLGSNGINRNKNNKFKQIYAIRSLVTQLNKKKLTC